MAGEEPKITQHRLAESTALLGGLFAERSLDRLERKKYFASTKNGARHTLSPEYVYTMEFYEDKVSAPLPPLPLTPRASLAPVFGVFGDRPV